MTRYRLGVDVGGTFTDGYLVDLDTGAMQRGKVLTTPDDQSVGSLEVMRSFGVDAAEIELFSHGSTVGLNALIQRTGVKTGLLCTEGLRDLLDMGRLRRPFGEGLYDPTWIRPHLANPLVHRRYVREVPGRMLSDGSVYVELDEDAVRREVRFLRDDGILAIAVCLLHAHVNDEHERRVVEIVREEHPAAYVQSSRVRPVYGEYARTFTTVIDAFVGPLIARYLDELERKVRAEGHDTEVRVMQMNGGVRTLRSTVEHFPAYALQSGPVAGILGAEHHARVTGTGNLVCVDIGGTSTDIGIVSDGRGHITDNWEFEFLMPLGVPAVDVLSVGAGGGSIIAVDEMGTVRVGPESAGAKPGPASYGLGGAAPTVTDAYVALGVIQPELFLAGRMRLDRAAALEALRSVAEPLELDPVELAEGALRLMNANLESEIVKMAFEQAIDVREYSLLAYGGAGALPAAKLARAVGLKEALVPDFPGGFSALGLVAASPKVERAMSLLEPIDQVDPDRLGHLFAELEEPVAADLEAQGVAAEDVRLTRSISGMYAGQSFDNRLTLASDPIDGELIDRWQAQFHGLYERLYGYSAPELPIIATSIAVTGTGRSFHLPVPGIEEGDDDPPASALRLRARVYDEGAWHDEVPFYRRAELLAGNRIAGPAILDDELATVLVDSRSVARVDGHGHVRITPTSEGGQT